MKASSLLLLALAAAPLFLAGDAVAQDDDYGDLDEDEPVKKETKTRKRPEVREIVRGFYAKSNVGSALYLLDFRAAVNPGTSVALTFGQDFLDQERLSASWDVGFNQGIHNGCYYEQQAADGCGTGVPGPFIQGDLRTYSVVGAVEFSFYPARRVGIGFRAGGGVLFSPLLMDEARYAEDVVADTWGGIDPGYHSGAHPLGVFGPTVEYYTKLSHFSVGVDVDVFYAVNFDLGANVTGFLKYTF
jgi:hypothetical protein